MPFVKCPECGKLNSVKLKNCPKCEASLDTACASYNTDTQISPAGIPTGAGATGTTAWGQPAQQQTQQPQNNLWGQPVQQQTQHPQNNPWGQPVQQQTQQPQNNPWGQPVQQQTQQPQNNPWGQPVQQQMQQPQNNPWGQPVQQNATTTQHCTTCGNQVVAGARFCAGCGSPVTATQQPAGIPTRKNPYFI